MKGVCIFLVLVSFMVKAEMNPSANDRARLINIWMKEHLELSADQIPHVEALNLKYEKRIDILMTKNEGFLCMQAVRNALKEKEKQLESLFSAKQFEKYCECRHELKEELRMKRQLSEVIPKQ